MKRSGPLRRKTVLARAAMKRRRPAAPKFDRDRSRLFREAAARQGRCAGCGTTEGQWDAHHILYKAHVRQEGGDIWAPANALRLCEPCHLAHHSRRRPLPLTCLPFEAIQWARDLLGVDRADEYLTRRYR